MYRRDTWRAVIPFLNLSLFLALLLKCTSRFAVYRRDARRAVIPFSKVTLFLLHHLNATTVLLCIIAIHGKPLFHSQNFFFSLLQRLSAPVVSPCFVAIHGGTLFYSEHLCFCLLHHLGSVQAKLQVVARLSPIGLSDGCIDIGQDLQCVQCQRNEPTMFVRLSRPTIHQIVYHFVLSQSTRLSR